MKFIILILLTFSTFANDLPLYRFDYNDKVFYRYHGGQRFSIEAIEAASIMKKSKNCSFTRQFVDVYKYSSYDFKSRLNSIPTNVSDRDRIYTIKCSDGKYVNNLYIRSGDMRIESVWRGIDSEFLN